MLNIFQKGREKEGKGEKKERKGEKKREKDVQGQLLSICIQFPKEKLNILAEMLKISKSGCRGSIIDHRHYKSSCRS